MGPTPKGNSELGAEFQFGLQHGQVFLGRVQFADIMHLSYR